ncbi:MAG: hypothetical protein Q9168_000756 [Polycauliona sp. 1 TL-2023]
MTEVSRRTSITTPFSLQATPSSPTRPASPKRTSVVGDSNSFLTALAAHERRVFELREELQKAEDDLSRLKKQWATHEAIKKRNEFRHREQLQKLKPASRSSYEECRALKDDPVAFDSYDHPSLENEKQMQEEQEDAEQKPDRQNSTRQIQRTVFAGSRHTRTLSLLSKVGTTRNTSNLTLQKPNLQALPPSETSSSPKRNKTLSTRRPSEPTSARGNSNGQPNEVFIETSKQIVGDLRDGLWTFFEDLRQATVGEDASSDPKRTVKAAHTALNNRTPQGSGQKGFDSSLEALPKDAPEYKNTSRGNPTLSTPTQQRPTKQLVPEDKRSSRFCDSTSEVIKPAVNPDDEDPWDTWDSPVVTRPISSNIAESINSDSVASPSTRRESSRSSLR